MGKNYSHLNHQQREQIMIMRAEGKSTTEIAAAFGCHRGRILRELKRCQGEDNGYSAYKAQESYQEERK